MRQGTKKRLSAYERLSKMNADQLAAETAQYDKEFVARNSRPLNGDQRSVWNKAKRKVGRPKVGRGHKVISLSLEQGLLDQATKIAKKLGISRAKLISGGVKAIVGKADRLNREQLIALLGE